MSNPLRQDALALVASGHSVAEIALKFGIARRRVSLVLGTGEGSRSSISGRRFRKMRQGLELSQEDLARVLGVSFMTVSRWERGETSCARWAVDRVQTLLAEKRSLG